MDKERLSLPKVVYAFLLSKTVLVDLLSLSSAQIDKDTKTHSDKASSHENKFLIIQRFYATKLEASINNHKEMKKKVVLDVVFTLRE